MLALYAHYPVPKKTPLAPDTLFGTGIVYSDDLGQTFKQQQQADIIPYLGEPQLAALPDIGPRAVMLNGRCADRTHYNKGAYPTPCNAGHRGLALSTDGGVTFGQTVYDKQLQDPNCQGSTVSVSTVNRGGGGTSTSTSTSTRTSSMLLFSGDDSRTFRMNMSVSTAVNVTAWPPHFTRKELIAPKEYADDCPSNTTNCGSAYSALFASGTCAPQGLLLLRSIVSCVRVWGVRERMCPATTNYVDTLRIFKCFWYLVIDLG